MFLRRWIRPAPVAGVAALIVGGGCSGLREWHANGFKVGPNYTPPVTHVAEQWTPAADPRLAVSPADLREWWAGLNDPALSGLLATAGEKNPSLRRAALKVAELEAVRGKTKGNLYPQSQSVTGVFVDGTISRNLVQGALQNRFSIWADGYMASWELDIWGRYRRAVEAADADLAGAVESYRDTLAGLLADTATAYVEVRTFQQRIALARETVAARQAAVELADSRVRNGTGKEADLWKAKMAQAQAEAAVPPLEIGLKQAGNRLAVLLGYPAYDVAAELPPGPVPAPPPVLAVGVPADLLRRRADVRKAERDLAAQSARVGVAESDLYPSFSLFGFFGYVGKDFPDLFNASSYTGIVSPSFDWKILNYGRVRNNIRAEDARLQQLLAGYEQTVLTAGREVEDGLAGYLGGLEQAQRQQAAVTAAEKVLALAQSAYDDGSETYDAVSDARATVLSQRDAVLTARKDALVSLIKTYRALGGGWECGPPTESVPAAVPVAVPANVPMSGKGPDPATVPLTDGSGSGMRTVGAVAP